MVRRRLRVLVGACLIWAALTGTALADPAGPTPYESTIVGIEPDVAGIEVRIIGGDSFFELSVDAGHEVTVLGYSGEPYLRFDADRTVLENRNSPATYLNEDRYAATDLPPNADADAAPDWVVLDDDGSWAWHDHRAHWMAPVPPFGLKPGDQVLDERVELTVDGVPVTVSVVSKWMPGPSHLSAALGALVGIIVSGVVAVVRLGRRGLIRTSVDRLPGTVLAVCSAVALAIGLWQTWSLPSETAPPITDWALPLVALAASLWAAAAPRSSGGIIAGVVAGVELVVWAVLRRDVLRYPVLPTNAPFWLDRAVTAGAFAAGLILTLTLLRVLFERPPVAGNEATHTSAAGPSA